MTREPGWNIQRSGGGEGISEFAFAPCFPSRRHEFSASRFRCSNGDSGRASPRRWTSRHCSERLSHEQYDRKRVRRIGPVDARIWRGDRCRRHWGAEFSAGSTVGANCIKKPSLQSLWNWRPSRVQPLADGSVDPGKQARCPASHHQCERQRGGNMERDKPREHARGLC